MIADIKTADKRNRVGVHSSSATPTGWTQIYQGLISKSLCSPCLRVYSIVLWALAFLTIVAITSTTAKEPSAKDILKSASKHYEVIEDYKADIKVSVESPKVHMPEMPATMYYKRPDKLHFESKEGFSILPKQGVMIGNPLKELLVSSSIEQLKSERAVDRDCYVIKGSFKKDGTVMESTVWIDKKDRLVRQMSVTSEDGPVVKVKVWYTRVEMKYWMPSSTVAQVSLPPLPSYRADEKQVRGQPTIVEMKFSNYRVNIGLSDSIFKKSPREKRRS